MKLGQYLSRKKIKPSAFAAELGVAPSTITRLLNGERSPRLDLVLRIRDHTDGEVQPDDFAQPEPAE